MKFQITQQTIWYISSNFVQFKICKRCNFQFFFWSGFENETEWCHIENQLLGKDVNLPRVCIPFFSYYYSVENIVETFQCNGPAPRYVIWTLFSNIVVRYYFKRIFMMTIASESYGLDWRNRKSFFRIISQLQMIKYIVVNVELISLHLAEKWVWKKTHEFSQLWQNVVYQTLKR